jgi:hypothetical protein
MKYFTKENITKALFEIAIVVVGVTIAFWVEQYRVDINNKERLRDALIDIDKGLRDDSIQVVSQNYPEIELLIDKIDTAISSLVQGKVIDMSERPNITSEPLQDFSNDNLNAFIGSETFNLLRSADLKRSMISYRLVTLDTWEKEKRLLDYMSASIVPVVHRSGNIFERKKPMGSKGLLTDMEITGLMNDLLKLRQEYSARLTKHWPIIVRKNSILRIEIQNELKKLM